jgi:hypothetical protein
MTLIGQTRRLVVERKPDSGGQAPARVSGVTDDCGGELSPVTVIRDRTLRAAGRRLGDTIVYDWGFELNNRPHEQRSFVLLDDGFQINQPVVFPAAQQGWWYCDLVRVTDQGDVVMVDDLWIDVIVGPADHPYRVLDLDEYAAAAECGSLSAADAVDGLVRTQRFLDRRLNRRHDVQRTWPDFPPKSISALLHASFPREWSLIDG